MVKGREFHPIIQKIFHDVKGYDFSEQIQVNCPKCQERDYSDTPDGKFNLEINTEKRVFRCWKCDEPKFSGSLGKLIRMYGTSSDYELYKSYAGEFFDYNKVEDGEEIETFIQLPEEYIPFSKMDITDSEHLEAYNYLVLERKLDLETILRFKMGFCLTGKYARRIIFPSYNAYGDLNYFVARTYEKGVKPTYLNPKIDKDNIVFNEGLLNWDSTIYIVEGGFDTTALINGVAMLGKTLSKSMFYMIKEKKPPIVIVLDPDAYKDAIRMFQTIKSIYVDEEDKVKIVKLSGNQDIDEIRIESGKKAVINKLYGAKELDVEDYFLFKKYVNYDKTKNRFGTYKKSKSW